MFSECGVGVNYIKNADDRAMGKPEEDPNVYLAFYYWSFPPKDQSTKAKREVFAPAHWALLHHTCGQIHGQIGSGGQKLVNF